MAYSRARILADYVGGGTTSAEFDVLDGLTSTTAELNYVDGVTSNVQTQLNTKAPLASPDFTGTVDLTGTTVSLDDDEISLDKVNAGTLGSGTIGGTSVISTSGAITTTSTLTASEAGITSAAYNTDGVSVWHSAHAHNRGLVMGQVSGTVHHISNQTDADDTSSLALNYQGYEGGTANFRDTKICDGKNNTIVFVDGSSANVGINTSAPSTNLHINGTAKSPLIEGELIYSHVFEWTSNASPSNNLDGLTYGNIGSGGSVYFFNFYWGNSTLGDSYGHKRTMCLYRGDYGGLNLINDFDTGYGYRSGTAGFQGYPYISNPGTGSSGQTVAVPFQLTGGGSASYGAAMYISVHRIDYRDNDSLFQTD